MDSTSKIKVRIRPRSMGKTVHVEVREKYTYTCRKCHNQYYDHHLFCPQCLGEVEAVQHRPSLLRVLSIPEGKALELTILLTTLSGKKDFPFQKALESLPWIMIQQTDDCILHHWKEVLEVEKAEVEIALSQPSTKRSWRGKAPVFTAKAPAPHFLSDAAAKGVRHVAHSLKDSAVRMKWVEAVLSGVRVVEDFYKRNPSHRVLFSDFLFNIDHDLQDAAKDYESLYKARESEMVERIAAIQAKVDGMTREIEEVRRQVEAQL